MSDWENLLAEHGPDMYRAACRILGRADEAEDCVQDVFLEIIGRSGACDVDHWAAVLKWMVTVRSLDRLRRRRTRREVGPAGLADVPSRRPDAAGRHSADEMVAWLRSAITELPSRRSQVFTLRYFADMSYDEIARAVGIEVNAVGVLLYEARRQLRTRIPAEWVENWGMKR